MKSQMPPSDDDRIAIVGAACRFPDAAAPSEFWANLCDGVESVRRLRDEQLYQSGVPDQEMRDPDYLKVRAVVDDVDKFDARFFGISPREAEVTDPQQRVMLEVAWEALESAGIDSVRYDGRIGFYGGAWPNTYLLENLYPRKDLVAEFGIDQLRIANRTDNLTTRVAYKLNLTGPSVTVQTTCSTSLVAVHLACQSLLNYDVDVALAGGVSIFGEQEKGFLRDGGVVSPDGHCRAFDADAQGTAIGNGAGLVVLKRLGEALADNDEICAVIAGSAINNDGSDKIAYTAPSVEGQAEVIAQALAVADFDSASIGYVECHGTGTPLGDPIEIEALTRAFGTEARGFCAIGSVKANIGHLDAAAGVAGLIKAAWAVKTGRIPPSVNHSEPNPEIRFDESPFFVNTELRDWPAGLSPRRAGVSSFGVGGTNAHLVLEEPPARSTPPPSAPQPALIPISGFSQTAADANLRSLERHVRVDPDLSLADVAHTLQRARRAFRYRRIVYARSVDDLRARLAAGEWLEGEAEEGGRRVAYLFPGGGSEYARMGEGLLSHYPSFRAAMEECAHALQAVSDHDLSAGLYDPSLKRGDYSPLLRPSVSLPSLFAVEYALSRVVADAGLPPSAMIGHSLGEYVAACVSGTFSVAEAMRLVHERGAVFERIGDGAMLAVTCSEEVVSTHLDSQLSLAAVNGPELCVVSGPARAIDDLETRLRSRSIDCRRVAIPVPAHSSMLEPELEGFREVVRSIRLQPPTVPWVSNLTGQWIAPDEAQDPDYWVRHFRDTVRFADGARTLLAAEDWILLELGPGRLLTSLIRQSGDEKGRKTMSLLPHAKDEIGDLEAFGRGMAEAWLAGAPLGWEQLALPAEGRRIGLPTYRFDKTRHWVDPPPAVGGDSSLGGLRRLTDPGDWYWAPHWTKSSQRRSATQQIGRRILVFCDRAGLGARVADELRANGDQVVSVESDASFEVRSDDHLSCRLESDGQWQQLKEALDARGFMPDIVIAGWGVGVGEREAACDTGLARSLIHSLLLLAPRVGELSAGEPLELHVWTENAQRVTSDDDVWPWAATATGVCGAITQEYPQISCRVIDVSRSMDSAANARLAKMLAAETLIVSETMAVALRGRDRWVIDHRPLPLDGVELGLPEEPVALITGGLGAVGVAVARQLASEFGARLVLMGRTPIPDDREWPELRERLSADDPVRVAIDRLDALRSVAKDVLYIPGDVSARRDVEAARELIEGKFGSTNLVVHAAGVLRDSVIQNKRREDVEEVLSAKIDGALLLDEVFGEGPELFVLCSSLSAIRGSAGQADYAAANAYLDAFAHYREQQARGRTISINWGSWKDAGLARQSMTRFRAAAATDPATSHPLLGRCVRDEEAVTAWASELRPETCWSLDEHRLVGRAVMPGAAFVDAVAAAATSVFGCSSIEIQELLLIAPLTVPDGSARYMHLEIARQGRSGEVRVWSALDPEGSVDRLEHVSAVVRPLDDPAPAPRFSSAAMGARVVEDAASLLESSRTGIASAFGPRWHCVEEIRAGGAIGIADLSLPEAFSSDLRSHPVHPALLDVALGFAARGRTGDGTFVALAYDTIRIWDRVTGSCRAQSSLLGREREQAELINMDVELVSDSGEMLVEVRGYVLKRLDAAQVARWESEEHQAPENFRLDFTEIGNLDDLCIRAHSRREPDDDEVEIAIEYAGINFGNVLCVLGLYPGNVELQGLECAGRIVRVGSGVSDLVPGESVVAMGASCFSAFVTTSRALVHRIPPDFGAHEAAALPVAFSTAHHALVHLARAEAGESVLIHSGAGGVGMAAITVARHLGLQIFATAGSASKRALLAETLGPDSVFDSRSSSFGPGVLAASDGRGVDIVLNSLGGELARVGLGVLAPGGRFIELGRRDIEAENALPLGALSRNRSFMALDMRQLTVDRPEQVAFAWEQVMRQCAAHELTALPTEVVSILHASDAFNRMSRGDHVGKLVLQISGSGWQQEVSGASGRSGARQAAMSNRGEEPGERQWAAPGAEFLRRYFDMGLTSQEGGESFERIVRMCAAPQVAVCPLILPLLTNRRPTDLEALVRPSNEKSARHQRPTLSSPMVPPQSPVECILAEVWSNMLGIEPIGILDNFFELGGDSLLCIRMVSKAAKQGVTFSANDLYDHPTIVDLAKTIEPTARLPDAIPFSAAQCAVPDGPGRRAATYEWILLRVGRAVPIEELAALHRDLATRHPILRYRPDRATSTWQLVESWPAGNPAVRDWTDDVEDPKEIATALNDVDAENGMSLTLTRVARESSTEDGLLLVADRLALDVYALSIILGDVAAHFGAEYSSMPDPVERLVSWQADTTDGARPTERFAPRAESVHYAVRTLSPEQTGLLLGEVAKKTRSSVEAILAAVLYVGSDSMPSVLEMEVDARGDLLSPEDYRGTAMRLTTAAVVGLPGMGDGTIEVVLAELKGRIRAARRGTMEAEEVQAHEGRYPQRIALCYEGPHDLMEFGGPSASLAATGGNWSCPRAGLGLTARVVGGEMRLYWTGDADACDGDGFENVVGRAMVALQSAIQRSLDGPAPEPRPQDFPDSGLSEEALTRLLERLGQRGAKDGASNP